MDGKKILLLAGALMLTTALTGCRVGSGNNSAWDETVRNEKAKKTVIELIDAIEDYEVAKIDELLAPEFELSIEDKGLFKTPLKNRESLLDELEYDESYQTLLRASTKYNYDMVIDMDYMYAVGEEDVYSPENPKSGMDGEDKQRQMNITQNATPSGTVEISCNFEVYENADGITPGDYIVTDTGTMKFELIYLGTEYKVKTMKTVFNGSEDAYTPRSMTYSSMLESDIYGFGLGKIADQLR